MKALTVILGVIVIVLSFLLYRQQAKIAEQGKAIADLSAQASENKRNLNSLEYQEKCAEQAHKAFDALGFRKISEAARKIGDADAWYENHYNEKLNKCFIEIRNTSPVAQGRIAVSKNVYDAIEGKAYGEYIWQSDKVKKYWEVPPFICKVVLLSGEERYCKSEDEFKELLKPYMDIS